MIKARQLQTSELKDMIKARQLQTFLVLELLSLDKSTNFMLFFFSSEMLYIHCFFDCT